MYVVDTRYLNASIIFLVTTSFLSLQWQQREGGEEHDTVKPLAANGFDLKTTILIDNEWQKGAPGEESNLLEMPTWERCRDQGEATWRALVLELRATELRAYGGDIRGAVRRVAESIQGVHLASELVSAELAQRSAGGWTGGLRVDTAGGPTGSMRGLCPSLKVNLGVGVGAGLPPNEKPSNDEDEEDKDAGPPPGKRMRTALSHDVGQGVCPEIALHNHSNAGAMGMLDGLVQDSTFPGAPLEAGVKPWTSAQSFQGNLISEALGEGGQPSGDDLGSHKRGRELQGAAPLYQGPRPWIVSGDGGDRHKVRGERHFSPLHDEVRDHPRGTVARDGHWAIPFFCQRPKVVFPLPPFTPWQQGT